MNDETQTQPKATERQGEASELSAVLSRIETLEKRVHDLEAALENSRPALQAASMFIPIGGNGPYVHKQGPLGEPFASILNENLDELYER